MGMSPGTTHGCITEMADQWKQLQNSPAARKGEDLDALRGLQHEALARLAWEALETLAKADKYSYAVSFLEMHLENEGDLQLGWVIAQADKDGGWNKWAKVLGGYAAGDGPHGDALIFLDWDKAKRAWDALDTSSRPYFRIFPVVLSAGREPRITPPR